MYIPGESTEKDFSDYLKEAGIQYIEEEGGYIYTPNAEHNYVNIPEINNTYADTVTKEDKVFDDPKLMRTPIVRNGKHATVGYCPDIWAQWE